MELTASHLLCFLLAFTPTTQELVELNVSPTTAAECDKQVTLNCSASSSQGDLLVTYMGWFRGDVPLCSVDSMGNMNTRQNHSMSDFHCVFEDRGLSLIFQKVLPLESGQSNMYSCKLRSDQGMTNRPTTVELQECCGTVEGVLMEEGPSCTFKQVYPNGDVHWFHGSHHLSGDSVRHNLTKSVDEHGWLTIHSWLTIQSKEKKIDSAEPYKCSLKSTTSGRYVTSTLVRSNRASVKGVGASHSDAKGFGSQGTLKTVISLLASLIVPKYWI